MHAHTLCHTPFLLLSMRHESRFSCGTRFMLASPRQSTFPFPQHHGVGLIKPLRVPMLRVPMLRVPMLRAKGALSVKFPRGGCLTSALWHSFSGLRWKTVVWRWNMSGMIGLGPMVV